MALAHSTSGNSRGHHLGLPIPRLLARALSFYLEGITFCFVLDQRQVQRPDQISTGELHTVPCVHESEYLVYTGLQQVLLGMEGQGSLRCQSVERTSAGLFCHYLWDRANLLSSPGPQRLHLQSGDIIPTSEGCREFNDVMERTMLCNLPLSQHDPG